ncbi:MAG: methyltransferase domain-containing protein [Deltaproteobacteria bacterium]
MIRDRAKRLVQALVRRRTAVRFDDLARTEPVARGFGWDRGTPIDRAYIAQFVAAHRDRLVGRVLEIGEARYAPRFAPGALSTTVLHVEPGNGLVGDLANTATLPAAAFDAVICTQVLGVIYDVAAAVAGLEHVLAPGGCALVTVSGIAQLSRFDAARWGDYWRFTEASLRRLFERFDVVAVESRGNVATAVALLQGVAVEDLPDPQVLATHDREYPVTLGVVAVKR